MKCDVLIEITKSQNFCSREETRLERRATVVRRRSRTAHYRHLSPNSRFQVHCNRSVWYLARSSYLPRAHLRALFSKNCSPRGGSPRASESRGGPTVPDIQISARTHARPSIQPTNGERRGTRPDKRIWTLGHIRFNPSETVVDSGRCIFAVPNDATGNIRILFL